MEINQSVGNVTSNAPVSEVSESATMKETPNTPANTANITATTSSNLTLVAPTTQAPSSTSKSAAMVMIEAVEMVIKDHPGNAARLMTEDHSRNTGVDLTTFTCFNKLPTELRLKIVSCCCNL